MMMESSLNLRESKESSLTLRELSKSPKAHGPHSLLLLFLPLFLSLLLLLLFSKVAKRRLGVIPPRVCPPFRWLLKAESFPTADAEFKDFLEKMLPTPKPPTPVLEAQGEGEEEEEEEEDEEEGKRGDKELGGVDDEGLQVDGEIQDDGVDGEGEEGEEVEEEEEEMDEEQLALVRQREEEEAAAAAAEAARLRRERIRLVRDAVDDRLEETVDFLRVDAKRRRLREQEESTTSKMKTRTSMTSAEMVVRSSFALEELILREELEEEQQEENEEKMDRERVGNVDPGEQEAKQYFIDGAPIDNDEGLDEERVEDQVWESSRVADVGDGDGDPDAVDGDADVEDAEKKLQVREVRHKSIGGMHFIGFDSRQSGDGADLGPLKDPIVIRPGWYYSDLFLHMTIAFSIGH